MLSKYTSKFIELLKEEVKLYEWAKENNPPNYDLSTILETYISTTKSSIWLTASEALKESYNYVYSTSEIFSNTLLEAETFNKRNVIFQWLKDLDSDEERDKAFVFLAKTVNRFVLEKGETSFNALNGHQFNSANGFVSDFKSLPFKEVFLTTTDLSVSDIDKDSWKGFANFDNNYSFYSDHHDDFSDAENKDDFIRWFLLPEDISIQKTPYSYTQAANPKLEEPSDLDFLISDRVIYFKNGEPLESAEPLDEFVAEIEPLELYALEIQSLSKYSVLDINIDVLLERLKTAVDLTSLFTKKDILPIESLSYKLVFNIQEQKSVVVPSLDMYQSVLYLKAMGSKEISLFYDSYEKRIVIKGETGEREEEEADERIGRFKKKVKKIIKKALPTFSIIYEQKLSELTSFSAVEYIEFFDPELSFRDKYDKLNTKRNSPLELPAEFIEEYPAVAASYEQQAEVSLSEKEREEKYRYVEALISEYLNSYTEIIDSDLFYDKETFSKLSDIDKSKKHRIAIPQDEWEIGDYVLTVNEAYWNYNSQIDTEELLAFFMSKGNEAGYRMLCLKILGVDYHLFEDSITDALLQTNDIYVSKLSIDEANITADIQFEGKNAYIAGNIYEKQSHIKKSGDAFTYKSGLDIFFGNELGSNLYDKALSTIDEAIEERFTPALIPLVKDEKEIKALELNVDINCPIFFQGEADSTNSSSTPVSTISTFLSTGARLNKINMISESLDADYNSSKKHNFGHYQLFKLWLKPNEKSILGQYTVQEITDAYIFPIGQDEYTYKYVFSLFKDIDKNIVGFNTDGGAGYKILQNIMLADSTTKLVLKELNYIENSYGVTEEEAVNIKKKFILLFKQRYWAARREGRRIFNEFLRKGIDAESRGIIDLTWNNTYNNYAKPDLLKVPMFPSHSYKFGKKSESNQFKLMEAQKEGIRHVLSRGNSGLFLHEVGFGKTTSSITAISSMMNTGEASRVLFLVPNSVYDKFQDEIIGNKESYGLLPNVNIVLLDNLTQDVFYDVRTKGGVKYPKNKPEETIIKEFTDLELATIENFKKFNAQFNALLFDTKRKDKATKKEVVTKGGLSAGRITFENDPIFSSSSSWDEALYLIKKELTKFIDGWENLLVLKSHIDYLETIYETANEEWQEIYMAQQDIVDDYNKTSTQKAKAEAKIKSDSESLGKRLGVELKAYVRSVTISLIDELGVYTDKTMAKKTILIAKHSAAENKIRPSKEAVIRALMFKEGLGEPSSIPKTLDLAEWAAITNLTHAKVKVAKKVLLDHPISLDRLGVDAVVIDEIHNFNNIVNRAGAKGWEHSGSNTYYNPSELTPTGKRKKDGTKYYSLDKASGNAANRYAIKYDSTGRAADSKGSKLTAAAICMDIQYKSKKYNNVLLLSATPFTDTPFQVVSVLGMANYEMLLENGIESSWDFFNNYVDETYKYDLRHDGAYGLFIDINGYYNDKALSNLITNVSNVKITDEKIEANRPKKAIIPANNSSRKKENGEDKSDVSAHTGMGDEFDELQFVNSRVQLSENQEKFQEVIREYIKNDEDQRPLKDVFEINEKRIKAKLSSSLDLEVEELVIEKKKEALTKNKEGEYEDADIVLDYLQEIYTKGVYAQHPIIKDVIDDINKKVYKINPPTKKKSDEDDELEAVGIDTGQMDAKQKLAGKAIGVQQAQQSLVISPYFVNLGDDSYTSPFLPDLKSDPATIFVEQSPKLMFVVESIKQTIKYQEKELAKGNISQIGGQVIYFDKHNFGYGGVKYNAFDLLAEYIAKNVDGISGEKDGKGDYLEIASIDGKTKIKDSVIKGSADLKRGRTSIKDGFNDGSIKILIGSKAIKEGIDLQGNSHTMYICEAEFSPEVAMQLEGRIWRQKNPYDVVRVVYVLAMNTIDSFVYSKINKKVNMIKRMLELGVYEMNTTQFVIDTKEMLIQLESDPDKLTEIQYQDEIDTLTNEVGTIDKKIQRLRLTKNNYETVEAKMTSKLTKVNEIYQNLSGARKEYLITKDKGVKVILRKKKALLKLQDHVASGDKRAVDEWQKDKKSSYDASKYETTEKEIEEGYVTYIAEHPKENPFPILLSAITVDTQMSEIEKIIIKVDLALQMGENTENTWRRADEKERQEIRDKKKKSISELNWIAYFDATENEDLARYRRELKETFINDVAGISVMDTYQAYIKNVEGKNYTIDDIDEIISEWEEKRADVAWKIDPKSDFKKELRAQWVVALEARKETTDGSIKGLVDSMEDSLELIKIRKK